MYGRPTSTAIEDGLEDLLCPEELARAARICRAQTGPVGSLAGRAAGPARPLPRPRPARAALRARPARQARAVPAGTARGGREDLRFNLSHSGGLALVAVTAGREVGVDLEVARRRVDELAIAARVLGGAQAARLAADPRRASEFMRAWVAHEAAVKCRGPGLSAAVAMPLARARRTRSTVDGRARRRPPRGRRRGRRGRAVRAALPGVARLSLTPPVRAIGRRSP